ncbi:MULTISPECIES: DUF262 domain-containing protein [Stenotrophomonas maltophilia group]|nr:MULTISPECIES: DUF262 domain-containing protein [Stenotrophomonas maltophilia group]
MNTLVEIPETQQEEEEDLSAPTNAAETYVVSSDWTLETISLQIRKGNIDLQPEFQRRAAWDEERKSRLVESFLVSIPVPSIVLAESKLSKGQFLVIDGKQRLVSIADFMEDGFKLKGLKMRPDLNGKSYKDLSQGDRDSFDNSTIRTTAIRKWQDEAFLYTIFYRLNSGSLPLSPQELRKALIGGRLINAIEDYLSKSQPFKNLFGVELDRRMRDSELVLRFVAFDLFLLDYAGDFKKFLDETARHFEVDSLDRETELVASLNRLDTALETVAAVFPGSAFKKWLGDKYERVMNRAVFDAVCRPFSDPAIAAAAVTNAAAVEAEFKRICLIQEFKASVEKTTKTRASTMLRIDMWGQALGGLLARGFDGQKHRVI